MLVCKKCNYESLGVFEYCPRCSYPISLDEREIREIRERQAETYKNKEFEAYVEYSKLLAFAHHKEGERDYAAMLEKGDFVTRDYDEAMRFYYRAAKKHDAFSAYRYSRLISRANEKAGNFWLLYSAVLGLPEAYPRAAELLSKEGYEADANYFYSLSAKHDDVDSIVELAGRYYKGIGVAASAENAKWYMEKLSFPPLFALKLSYKLKGAVSKEPLEINFDKEAFITRLLPVALECEFREAYFKLTEILAKMENREAMTVLATLLVDGVGCVADTEEAIRLFTEAAALGSADSYICLARLFMTDEYTEPSIELAIRYLDAAVKLESGEAAFMLGEIYESGEYFARDYKKSALYFEKAYDFGIAEAKGRYEGIIKTRNKFFEEGLENREISPEKAFRAFAIAAAMGHKNAYIKLADAYLSGRGVGEDRRAAFFWYKEAVLAGDEKAFYPLGLCYAMGVGVNRDFRLARDMFNRAEKAGSLGARRAISNMYEAKRKRLSRGLYSRAMRLVYKKKFAEAKLALECAFELGFIKAGYLLGCFFEFGLGVIENRALADRYYVKAYEAGFKDTGAKYKKVILKLIR